METPAAVALLISLVVLFGLGLGAVAKMLFFRTGSRAASQGTGVFGFMNGSKLRADSKIAADDAIKQRLEKTFSDSASRTED